MRRNLLLSKADYKYFQKARQVANISDFSKTQIGCIAIYHRDIIGFGVNSNKTHPIQDYYNRFRELHNENNVPCIPKLHAEINCLNSIRNKDIDFSRVKIYIYRIRKDQQFGLSRPCPSCMAALKDLGVKHIYYTTNDGFVYEKLDYSSGFANRSQNI